VESPSSISFQDYLQNHIGVTEAMDKLAKTRAMQEEMQRLEQEEERRWQREELLRELKEKINAEPKYISCFTPVDFNAK
jgi:hypothetical protein